MRRASLVNPTAGRANGRGRRPPGYRRLLRRLAPHVAAVLLVGHPQRLGGARGQPRTAPHRTAGHIRAPERLRLLRRVRLRAELQAAEAAPRRAYRGRARRAGFVRLPPAHAALRARRRRLLLLDAGGLPRAVRRRGGRPRRGHGDDADAPLRQPLGPVPGLRPVHAPAVRPLPRRPGVVGLQRAPLDPARGVQGLVRRVRAPARPRRLRRPDPDHHRRLRRRALPVLRTLPRVPLLRRHAGGRAATPLWHGRGRRRPEHRHRHSRLEAPHGRYPPLMVGLPDWMPAPGADSVLRMLRRVALRSQHARDHTRGRQRRWVLDASSTDPGALLLDGLPGEFLPVAGGNRAGLHRRPIALPTDAVHQPLRPVPRPDIILAILDTRAAAAERGLVCREINDKVDIRRDRWSIRSGSRRQCTGLLADGDLDGRLGLAIH